MQKEFMVKINYENLNPDLINEASISVVINNAMKEFVQFKIIGEEFSVAVEEVER